MTEQLAEGDVICDLEKTYHCLKDGLVGEDDVDLTKYLTAYKELYNFFLLLGKGFQFVSSDVVAKIKIIHDLQEKEKATSQNLIHFETVWKMLQHEKGEGLLEEKKYVSGSRTLLRLHRGLDFIRKFLEAVHSLNDSIKITNVCQESYEKTLGNFHPWVIKKAARMAMHLLPTKHDLLIKLTRNDAEKKKWLDDNMSEMLKMMDVVYDRVEHMYTVEDLHGLP